MTSWGVLVTSDEGSRRPEGETAGRRRLPAMTALIATVAIVTGVSVLDAATAIAFRGAREPLNPVLRQRLLSQLPSRQPLTTEAVPHKRTKRGAHLFKCKVAKGGRCGTLRVPLDRAHPARGDVRLFFEYYRHSKPGPANKAIMLSEGGPGYSVTETQFEAPFYHDTFGPLLKHRDLIMLDQRGVGRSGAIRCKGLQHHADFASPRILHRVARCGRQLGRRASLYGSGDVARDMNAVRRALGIKKLDLYGGSYAGQDVQSYAARFPKHVRSAILDSPFSASLFDSGRSPLDDFGTDLSHAGPGVASRLCARSQSCARERDHARIVIAWLAKRLRNQPLVGTGLDANGNAHDVDVTEGFLGWNLLQSDAGGYAAPSEIAAAAAAFKAGDDVPLLRLAAENDGGNADSTPAKVFSDGDNVARTCTDLRFPWSKSAPVKKRKRQWRHARSQLPDGQFGPFSVNGWLTRPPSPIAPDPCIAWPAPKRHTLPAVPRHAKFPGKVPALIVTGDLDLSLPPPDSKPLTRLWPHSHFVKIRGAGHHTFFSAMSCADPMIVRFIRKRKPGNTRCARKFPSKNSFPAVGRFPLTAADAREAAVNDGGVDQSTSTDRKVATAASAAITDAFRRTFLQSQTGPGPGLRGGTFTSSFGADSATAQLASARFTTDVAVSGTADYLFQNQAIDATVTVDGPGSEDGNLDVNGVWFGFGIPTTTLDVTGTLHGRSVSLTVPAS